MLTINWITEGHLDYEYKKYQVLAYLQKVKKDFDQKILYPTFSELLMHFKNLGDLKAALEKMQNSFKKNLSGLVYQHPVLKAIYENPIEDPEFLNELDQILNFSLPLFQSGSLEGKKIFEEAASLLNIRQVGIHPKNINEGYFMILPLPKNKIDVYRYKIGFFTDSTGAYRSLETNLTGSHPYTFSSTPENLKLGLIRQFPELPNPAVYAVQIQKPWPQNETLLPVLKRVFLQRLAL